MAEQAVRLPYWDSLTESEKETVLQNSFVKTYAKGAYLKGPQEACLGMIYLLSGSVRALMISEEGREITLFRIGAGDACILSASCILSQITFETQMIATEETRILVVSSGTYSQLMAQNLAVRCFSYELAAERTSAVVWVLQQILFAGFDRRLARYLLEESDRLGRDEITMSKEAIAREVNTAREVVSRMLKQFADDGLLSTNQKTITLLDKDGLKDLL